MSNPHEDLLVSLAKIENVFVAVVEERERIMSAIHDYHFALDERRHGGIAAELAIGAIQQILTMPWVQGAEQKRREEKS